MRNLPTACRLQFHQHGSCFLDQGQSSLQSIEKLTPPVFPSPFNPTHRHETAAAIRHRHETAAAIRGAGELVGAPRLGPPPGAQRRPPLPLVAHTTHEAPRVGVEGGRARARRGGRDDEVGGDGRHW